MYNDCIGDNLFHALGLPAWSNGTTGTHYPAIEGSVFIIGGIRAINYTQQKKERFWVWTIVLVLFAALKMMISYMQMINIDFLIGIFTEE